MQQAFPSRLYVVYLYPPSLEELKRRLERDERDQGGSRFLQAITELEAFQAGGYDHLIDSKIAVETDGAAQAAHSLYAQYLASLS